MVLQQIYSDYRVPNFIKIARVLWKILRKIFWYLFFEHTVGAYLHLENIATIYTVKLHTQLSLQFIHPVQDLGHRFSCEIVNNSKCVN